MVKTENLTTRFNYFITYKEHSKNIDSFYIYYKDEFRAIITYQYDTLHHPYKNVKIPFDGIQTYFKSSENNVIESIYFAPGIKPKTLIERYEIKYNKYGYPLKIEEVFNGHGRFYEEFSYINCIQ